MVANVLTRREARVQLVRRQADRLVDSDALTMFGLFGLSWAIPAAVVRIGNALSSLLRRRLHRAVH